MEWITTPLFSPLALAVVFVPILVSCIVVTMRLIRISGLYADKIFEVAFQRGLIDGLVKQNQKLSAKLEHNKEG